MRAALAAALLLAAGATHADAGLLDALNAARGRGCGGKTGLAQPLGAEPALDTAARLLSQSVPAGDALPRAGYRATRWVMFNASGSSDVAAIAEHVARHSCGPLVDPDFTQVGIHRRADQTWMLFAAPFTPPRAADAEVTARQVLELVNQARGQARACGEKRFPAVGPLRSNSRLDRAARGHSEDMAGNGFFGHDGSDGSTVMVRVTRAGYAGRAVGENVAAGQATPEAAVEGWVKSPPHCANLMNPVFTEMGIAFVVNPASPTGIYWTQVFGTPR